jgi:ATP citrate (pro-S)-lyase
LEFSETNDLDSGMQTKAVQGMLDFDFICKRKQPSVAGIIYTFGGQFVSKM